MVDPTLLIKQVPPYHIVKDYHPGILLSDTPNPDGSALVTHLTACSKNGATGVLAQRHVEGSLYWNSFCDASPQAAQPQLHACLPKPGPFIHVSLARLWLCCVPVWAPLFCVTNPFLGGHVHSAHDKPK